MTDATSSGVFVTEPPVGGESICTVNYRGWPAAPINAGCAGANPMGHVLSGVSRICSTCGGGVTTQWTSNGYSTLQSRTYCLWCEDPRTIALKAKIAKETT